MLALLEPLKDGMTAASMFGLQNITFSMPSYQFFPYAYILYLVFKMSYNREIMGLTLVFRS